jgi:hypothetical protein
MRWPAGPPPRRLPEAWAQVSLRLSHGRREVNRPLGQSGGHEEAAEDEGEDDGCAGTGHEQ